MSLTVGDISSSRTSSISNNPATSTADAGDQSKDAASPSASPTARASEDVVRAARTLFQNNAPTARMGQVPGEEGPPAEKPIILAGRCSHGGWCGR